MTATTEKARIGVYLSSDIKKAAERMAQEQKRSLSNFIEVLLDEAIQKQKSQSELNN